MSIKLEQAVWRFVCSYFYDRFNPRAMVYKSKINQKVFWSVLRKEDSYIRQLMPMDLWEQTSGLEVEELPEECFIANEEEMLRTMNELIEQLR